MKKTVVFFAVLFFACIDVVRAADHDVLAHAAGDWCWFARVSKIPPYMQFDQNAPTEQTEVFARENGPGQSWKSLLSRPLPGRVVALATRSSQLAVLLKDGQWKTLWTNDSASGQPLPASGQMRTIADDGTDMWAIGSVPGGINAANQAIAQSSSTTRPATYPTTGPFSSGKSNSTDSRLVVFRQLSGQWATVAELPTGKSIAPDANVSLVVVAGCPMVAFKAGDGKIQIIRCGTDHHWEDLAIISPPTTQPAVDQTAHDQTAHDQTAHDQTAHDQTAHDQTAQSFQLLTDGYDPFFWQSTGSAPGELFVGLSEKSRAIPLDWGKNQPLDGPPTAIFFNGFVCLFGPSAQKVVEQRYERDGKPFETAVALVIPGDGSDRMLAPWLEIAFLCMMGFLVGSSVFQQWSQTEKPVIDTNVVPAGLFPRFSAGMIDLLPIVGAISIILTFTGTTDDLMQVPSLKVIVIFAAGLLVYLLHTTIGEVWMSRSIGKWLMGLRVVTIQGKEPAQSQLLIRNLLRVVDPLVMILFSSLRQRSADTVAGTMVIEVDAESTPLTVTDEPGGDKPADEIGNGEAAD